MHVVLFTVLLKVNWNSRKKYNNKKIISKQKLKFSKPPAGQKPSKVCSEVIFFLFWKLQHQLDRKTQTMGYGTTWDLRAGPLLLQTQEGSPAQNGSSQDFHVPNLSRVFWEPWGHWLQDGLWGPASAARKPKFQPLETHIHQQLPRQASRMLSVRKTSASEWDS